MGTPTGRKRKAANARLVERAVAETHAAVKMGAEHERALHVPEA